MKNTKYIMEIPDNYLKQLETRTRHRSKRDENIQFIVEQINKERARDKELRREGRYKGKVFPPISFIAVKIKVAHLADTDLEYLITTCKEYSDRGITEKDLSKTFSRCFFGSLKV